MAIRVTVWNEYLHEVQFPEVAEVYPKGIHGCIADFLKDAGMEVRTATLKEPEHGLTQEAVSYTHLDVYKRQAYVLFILVFIVSLIQNISSKKWADLT